MKTGFPKSKLDPRRERSNILKMRKEKHFAVFIPSLPLIPGGKKSKIKSLFRHRKLKPDGRHDT